MHVEFKTLKFKNVLSYGNRWTEIDFTSGLNLIKATNGSGKSAILDAINFCLFGKPFRNIKIGQLINKYNAKNLVVGMTFQINKDEYEIIRGLKPGIFKLARNGNEIDDLSSKRLNQEEIEKLLGINERLFKNIVGIAVTNNKPFLTMSIGDKRSLIESIFNIDVLSAMAREVKKRNTLNDSELRLKLSENKGIQTSIADNKSYIERINKYIEQFDETKKTTCENLQKSIGEYEKAISSIESNISKGNSAVEKLEAKVEPPSTEDFIKVSQEIGAAQNTEKTVTKNLKDIGEGAFCPLCGGELDEGHSVTHIKELKATLDKLKNEVLPRLIKQQAALNKKKEEYDALQQKINVIKQKVVAEQVKLKTNTQHLETLRKQLKTEQEKKCDFNTSDYEKKLVELEITAAKLGSEINEAEHRLKIDSKLIDILGDEGLRMYFFKKLLPILNKRINYYLKRFELPATLELNPMMEETITTGRFEQSYNQFSNGEKARIDMAILLSFFDISKMISNWSCSILFVDEVMDAGVDSNGTEQFLSTFYSIVSEEDKNVGIYIISHKLADVQINWSNVIEVQKKSMFSELKKGSEK